MDVRFSPEQRALRDSAAQVVDRLGPQAVGQLDDHERVAKLDAAVTAAGWRELRTATDDGALWASGVEVGIVAAELGRGLADVGFLGPTLAADLRRLAAAPAATSPETVVLVPDLSGLACAANGRAPSPEAVPVDRGAPSVGAAPSDRDPSSPQGVAIDGGSRSSGALAIDVRGASSALVLVPAAGGHAVAQVDLPGSDADSGSGVDLTRPVVTLDPSAAVVPVPDQGRVITGDDLTRWTALGLATTSADLVGTMQGAVQLATEYAKERRQFGSAVGSFQAVQHLLADALVSTEGSRSAALHAAWAVDALPLNDALAAAAAAKAYCARAARTVCETAIQVHGGMGNTWECLAHVHLRRALLSSDVLGGVGASLARVLDHHGIDGSNGGRRGLR